MTSPHAPVLELLAVMRHRTELDDIRYDEFARALYERQRERVSAYDAWCIHELATRADPTVRAWPDIPALPIAAFKQLQVADPAAPITATWESSGTTAGHRSIHRLVSTDHYDASIDAGVAAALVPDVLAGRTEPLACVQLQPTASDAPRSSLTHMFDRIRTGAWCTDAGVFVDARYEVDAEGAWSRLTLLAGEGRPVLILATSFALALVLERVAEQGWPPITLPAGSRVVDTGGYKGRTREYAREELLDQVIELLGVEPASCENEYGMSELSSQAWLGTIADSAGALTARNAPGARWTPSWLRVRVVDPVTLAEVGDGEQGLLVFHDLANVWSCAAIRSEDLGIKRGSGFELVGRAPGATLKGCSLQLEHASS